MAYEDPQIVQEWLRIYHARVSSVLNESVE